MTCHRAVILALPFVVASAVHAQETAPPGRNGLCQSVVHHLWSDVATSRRQEQTPLAALVAAAPAAFRVGGKVLGKPGQSIADALIEDHAAEPKLAARLRDQPPRDAVRFGESDVWLLDRVDGTLGCHTAMTVVVPASGPAHETGLPGNPDPTVLCALSALTAVSIDGMPALWIEQSGAFSNVLAQSTITIAGLHETAFDPPCTVAVEYAVTDHAAHAFCDGVDCVPLIRLAEMLAMRLRQGETAETLGAGVIATEDEDNGYRRMADIVAAEKQTADLPTFGVSLDTPYLTFADQAVFPVRLGDGHIFLARIGHGGFGWRQTADTLLALYRMRDDQLMPAAGVYVDAQRTGITGIAIQ
jgi:hypothetical protein